MKQIRPFLALTFFLGAVPLLHAQGSFDVALGFGTAHAKATGLGIDENTFNSCTPSSTDLTCKATPSLGGLFMGFSGDGMLNKHMGIGGEFKFQPSKDDYGPLEYRQIFYDFDGIYAPITRRGFSSGSSAELGAPDLGFRIRKRVASAPRSAQHRLYP